LDCPAFVDVPEEFVVMPVDPDEPHPGKMEAAATETAPSRIRRRVMIDCCIDSCLSKDFTGLTFAETPG
jgi:hypothetical protein